MLGYIDLYLLQYNVKKKYKNVWKWNLQKSSNHN